MGIYKGPLHHPDPKWMTPEEVAIETAKEAMGLPASTRWEFKCQYCSDGGWLKYINYIPDRRCNGCGGRYLQVRGRE